jgi:hypothetical protein
LKGQHGHTIQTTQRINLLQVNQILINKDIQFTFSIRDKKSETPGLTQLLIMSKRFNHNPETVPKKIKVKIAIPTIKFILKF